MVEELTDEELMVEELAKTMSGNLRPDLVFPGYYEAISGHDDNYEPAFGKEAHEN